MEEHPKQKFNSPETRIRNRNIFMYEIPQSDNTFRGLLASHKINMTNTRIQRSINEVTEWMNNWNTVVHQEKIVVRQEKIQAIYKGSDRFCVDFSPDRL